MAVALVVVDDLGAAGCNIPYYSAVVVGGHRAAGSEAVAGTRFVVAFAAAHRYPAFAYR